MHESLIYIFNDLNKPWSKYESLLKEVYVVFSKASCNTTGGIFKARFYLKFRGPI